MRSFIAIYYGGTGSSWLMNVLGSIPRVQVAAYEPLESWHWAAPVGDKLAWLRAAVTPPDPGDEAALAEWTAALAASPQFRRIAKPRFDVVGFKMTVEAVADRAALFDVLRVAGTRLVVLMRRNRIKHALSLYRSHEEAKNQFRHQGLAPPSTVDLVKFDGWVEHAQGWHARTEAFASLAAAELGGDKVTSFAYEEFAADEGKTRALAEICAFLSLDPTRIRNDGGYRKATADDLRAAIVNYDEVAAHYVGTPLAPCFA